MKENKKFIILGFVIIIVVAVASFILGIKLANKTETKEQNPQQDIDSNVKEESVDIEYLSTMIPNYITVGEGNDWGYNIYQNKLITVDEIPADKLSLSVYFELNENHDDDVIARVGEFEGEPNYLDYEEVEDYEKAYEQKCLETGNLYFSLSCYVKENGYGPGVYSEKIVEKIYKKFYGENYNYTAPEFIGYFAAGCSLQGEYYFCEEGGGFGPNGEYNYSIVVNSEVKDNHVYIYEDYLYIDTVCDNDLENCVDLIFTDSTKTKKIGEVSSEEDAYEQFKDKAVTYKHTYKKNSDGTYYWYSVEPVK